MGRRAEPSGVKRVVDVNDMGLPFAIPAAAASAPAPRIAAGTKPPPLVDHDATVLTPVSTLDLARSAARGADHDATTIAPARYHEAIFAPPAARRQAARSRLITVVVAAVAVAALIGGYLVFRTSAHVAPSPDTPSVLAPASHVARPLVTLSITSDPPDAAVTLIDSGNARVIGRTPTTIELAPTRTYDLVFAARGEPTLVRHVDPRTTDHVLVDLRMDSTNE